MALLASDRRFRNGAAGAAFVVTLFVGGYEWIDTLLERYFYDVLARGGIHYARGPGALVAGAGALVGLAGVAWDLAATGPRLAAPRLPDDDRWN